jgi:hypothetical protein
MPGCHLSMSRAENVLRLTGSCAKRAVYSYFTQFFLKASTFAYAGTLMLQETEDINLTEDVVRQGVRAVLENPSKGYYLVSEVLHSLQICN